MNAPMPSPDLSFTDALHIIFPRKSKTLDHENWTKTIHYHSSTVQSDHLTRLLSLLRVLIDGSVTYVLSSLSNATNRLKSEACINDTEHNPIDSLIVDNINNLIATYLQTKHSNEFKDAKYSIARAVIGINKIFHYR